MPPWPTLSSSSLCILREEREEGHRDESGGSSRGRERFETSGEARASQKNRGCGGTDCFRAVIQNQEIVRKMAVAIESDVKYACGLED